MPQKPNSNWVRFKSPQHVVYTKAPMVDMLQELFDNIQWVMSPWGVVAQRGEDLMGFVLPWREAEREMERGV